MTPQELKNSILQLAIQGKLVEQRPEEGTAEELYKQIQAEKLALIKAGKIKKEKPLPEITEDEIPFEIPESWMWVRLNTVISLLSGSDLTPDKYNAQCKGIPYITGASNIEGNSIIINRWTEYPNNIAHCGDLLLTCKGTVGKTSILAEKEVHIARQIMAITPILVDTVFIQRFIECQVDNLKSKAKSMIPGIERDNVLKLALPLPPLAEQKRIVAKIEELLPLIERYEKAWTRLEDFNKRFPGDMQKSILQVAIQGKLVEQRPEEGTGEELYRQIQAEKQALIKAGKIKKEKPLPEITEAEIPFEIPESWKWVQIGEICSVVTGRLDANAQDPNGAYAFFTCGVEVYKTKDYAFDCDAVLLGGNNASGDYKMHRYAGKFNAYQRVYVITDPPKETLDYLFYVIKWWLPSLKHNSQGTTTRFIKLGQVTGMLVPIPPLAEQKRIVAQLEELLPLCERLK